jgi:hypothetical protein
VFDQTNTKYTSTMKNIILGGIALVASLTLTLTANAQTTNMGNGTLNNSTTNTGTIQTQPTNRSVIEGNRSRTGTMQQGTTTGPYQQTTSGSMQQGQGTNRNLNRSTDRTTNQQMDTIRRNNGGMNRTMPRSSSMSSSPMRRDTLK